MIVIYGLAGTGKSTYMASLIRAETRSFVVLAATHSAVENIYRIVGTVDRRKFMTLYSYFRIDYINNMIRGVPPSQVVGVIYIDEFSLINKHLFRRCLMKVPHSEVILCGDPLQLNAIYDSEESITFTELKALQDLPVPAIQHYHLSIFGLKEVDRAEKIKLTKIKRSDDAVQRLFNAIFVNGDKEYDGFKFVTFDEMVHLVHVNEYVVLASKYARLQEVYDELVFVDNRFDVHVAQKNDKGFKRLHFYKGMELMMIETTDDYYNGQRVYFDSVLTDGSIYVVTESGAMLKVVKETILPVTPSNLLTVHKAQGMTIPKIIVILDDMFDPCMLYTAITRAKTDVLFYTKESDKVKALFDSACIDVFHELRRKVYAF